MKALRLPDCRPPRRDDSLTSASSHPELISGYLAMRPRITLTPSDRAIHRQWSRWTIGAVVAVTAALLALTGPGQSPTRGSDADAYEPTTASTCAAWHDAASRAVGALVHGRPGADLQQVSNAVARMQSARRNCELGFVKLACRDYQAVILGAAARVNITDALPTCETSSRDTAIGARTP